MAGKTPSSQQVAQQRARKKVKLPRRLLAHKVLRALVNPLRSPHKLQPNMLVVLLLNMV